jgi:hypothetical protein
MSSTPAVVVDVSLRFARTNPELMACAVEAAINTGRSVDSLLLDAVARVRAAAAEHHSEVAESRPPRLVVLAAQPRRYRSRSVESSRRTDTTA